MPQCAKCGKVVRYRISYETWKHREYFPELYDKPLCKGCFNKLDVARVRQMDESERERLIEWLCEDLRRIGLDATVGSKERKRLGGVPGICSSSVMGSVRIANRNIDLVELNRFVSVSLPMGDSPGGDRQPDVYWCTFVVQAKVEGLEEKLEAKGRPVRKSLLDRQVVDFTWKGKELAQILNSDAKLKSRLLSQHQPSNVEIVPFKEDRCIRISQEGDIHPPTIETFEACDRIAYHVRSIAEIRP